MNWITNYVRPKINSLLQRKEMPENLWVKCPETGEMVFHKDLEANMGVIPNSGYHMRITAKERLGYFFDDGEYTSDRSAEGGVRSAEVPRQVALCRQTQGTSPQHRYGRFRARGARQVRRHRDGGDRP